MRRIDPFYRLLTYFLFSQMELPNIELRYEWLKFELMGFTPEVEADYLRRLREIHYRPIFRVLVLDFDSLEQIDGGNVVGALRDRLEMVHRGADGAILFRSHVWRSQFSIRGPLIRGLMPEFFSIVYYRDGFGD